MYDFAYSHTLTPFDGFETDIGAGATAPRTALGFVSFSLPHYQRRPKRVSAQEFSTKIMVVVS